MTKNKKKKSGKKDPRPFIAVLFILLVCVALVVFKCSKPKKAPILPVKVITQWVQPEGRSLGIALSDKNIFITETQFKSIHKYSLAGKLLDKWSGVQNPNGIGISKEGNIYVNDNATGQVKMFSESGKVLKSWKYNFYGQRGLAVDSLGNIFITDTGNHRVVKFDKTGQYLMEFGKKGRGKEQMDEPIGIALDKKGFIYVAEARNHRIHKFSPSGKSEVFWSYLPGAQGGYGIEPYLAIDKQGNIIMSDTHNSRLQVFTPAGKVVGVTEPGAFESPLGVAVDSDGIILVLDKGYRIQKVVIDTQITEGK